MQLTVERDELLRAVGQVYGVPSSKSDIPILTHLVLTAEREGGWVRGTDMEMDITSPFKAKVNEAGAVCVPARLIHDIVKRMPAGETISLSTVGEQFRLVCGKSRFQIAILPTEDYPPFSSGSPDRTWQFEIEADRLRMMLVGVRHAIAKDESRYYLGGVYLHVTADEPVHLKAVATNGHCLALQSTLAPVGSYGMPGIIIPREAVAEMVKLLPDQGQLVTLTVSDRFVWLDLPGGLSFGSKLIDGTYPEYDRVIPKAHPHYIRVAADALSAAIGRVATICDASHNGIVLLMNPKGPLSLTAERPAAGSAHDRLDILEISGPRRALGLNYRYLVTMLQSYAGGTVELRYNDAGDPIVLTHSGSDIGLQVLMPMRAGQTEAEPLDEAA